MASIRILLVAVVAAGPAVGLAAERQIADAVYQHAVVAADHRLASAAGVEILRQGGNVVDAAVAVGFALSVVRPASSGIGGGGFMLICDAARKKIVALDYRETAPAKATRDMYVDPMHPGRVSNDASRHGHLAVAVPGHVAGLCYALHNYGTKDLAAVLAPALRLCREGVPVDAHDFDIQAGMLSDFQKRPELARRFAALHTRYLNCGKKWQEQDRFCPPLASVLERIAERGADGFYKGPVAQAIVAEMQRGGGLLSLDDLSEYRPIVREALAAKIDSLPRDYELYTMPPPSSGGIALIETLQILDSYNFPQGRGPASAVDRMHLLTEAFKHAFADRAAFLGDADFADVPVRRLTGRAHALDLARRIDIDRTQPAESYGRFHTPDDAGTTHFSIIDAAGNAVACTETINTTFGSFVVEPTYGIILNNEMDDFAALPNVPNAFGLVQSEANAVAPCKRPLSSMTPTILARNGAAHLALGASGGPRIITATTQVLLNMTKLHMHPGEAVGRPRLHHQWLPDRLELERGWLAPEQGFEPAVDRQLRARGHEVRIVDYSAVVQAVSRQADGLRGASDLRKHGKAAGY